ncbi:MAG: isoprenylcysteine carboxylmethyltransferase family protein [Gemmatimonadales bacterium]
MLSPDLGLYVVHFAFWSSFGITRTLQRARGDAAAPVAPAAAAETTAQYSRALLILHSLAFGVMYFGIGNAVIPGRVPELFPGQRIVGGLIIGLGAALMSWALTWFQSWRFRAKLDAGHQLATGGPFHYLRHPLYMGLNLLALGSAIWVPTNTLWIAVVLMVIGSDLRGRAEERLLTTAFGDAYRNYALRTRRFLPGIY